MSRLAASVPSAGSGFSTAAGFSLDRASWKLGVCHHDCQGPPAEPKPATLGHGSVCLVETSRLLVPRWRRRVPVSNGDTYRHQCPNRRRPAVPTALFLLARAAVQPPTGRHREHAGINNKTSNNNNSSSSSSSSSSTASPPTSPAGRPAAREEVHKERLDSVLPASRSSATCVAISLELQPAGPLDT